MKKYKNLVPLFLVVLVVLSSYMLFSDAMEDKQQYELCLKKAREAVKQGIIVDAASYYKQALEIKETVGIRVEVGEMLVENDMVSDGINWAEDTLERYPKETGVYESLLQIYTERKDYEACFELVRRMEGNKIASKKTDEMLAKIRYQYEEGYKAYDDVSVFSEGLCAVKIDGLWGYSDTKGSLAIKAQYQEAGAFLSGVAPVVSEQKELYYIDVEGNKKVVFPKEVKAKKLGLVTEDTLVLNNGGKFGYYNTSFEHKFGEYDYASTMSYNIAAVREGGEWYLIDQKGKKLHKKAYKDIVLDEKEVPFRNGRAFVDTGNGYVMVDEKAEQVGEKTYEEANVFLDDSYAAVKLDGKWGFVDDKGKVVIKPEYEEARSFSNGLAAVKKGDKWGFINEKNEMAIQSQFDGCMDFNSNGSAFVKKGEEWVVIQLYSHKEG